MKILCTSVLLVVFWATTALGLTLTWTDTNNGAASVHIERKIGTGNYVSLGTVGPGVAQFTDAAATGGASYCYHVFAFNSKGESPDSNEACVFVTPPPGSTNGCYLQPAPGTLVCEGQ